MFLNLGQQNLWAKWQCRYYVKFYVILIFETTRVSNCILIMDYIAVVDIHEYRTFGSNDLYLKSVIS